MIAVDDSGGMDPDISALSALPGVRVVQTPFNLGHQDAIVFGLRKLAPEIAADDLVVTLDCDGEDQPADLPRLLAPLLVEPQRPDRIALAWRTKREESLAFRVLYFFFKLLFRTLTGTVIRIGNFAAYHGALTHSVLFHPNFNLVYSSSLISLSLDAVFVPCARGRRYAGQSRMGLLKLAVHGVRMLMPFLDRITLRALLSFAVLLGVGLASLAVLGVGRLLGRLSPPPWLWLGLCLTSALLFLAMVSFVILFAIFCHLRGVALHGLSRRAGDC
jgi:hypothetical protein